MRDAHLLQISHVVLEAQPTNSALKGTTDHVSLWLKLRWAGYSRQRRQLADCRLANGLNARAANRELLPGQFSSINWKLEYVQMVVLPGSEMKRDYDHLFKLVPRLQ